MKKSLLLALAFAAVCGYVMADGEETQAPQAQDETMQPTQPAPAEEAKPAQPTEEDDAFDMSEDLEKTEEVK